MSNLEYWKNQIKNCNTWIRAISQNSSCLSRPEFKLGAVLRRCGTYRYAPDLKNAYKGSFIKVIRQENSKAQKKSNLPSYNRNNQKPWSFMPSKKILKLPGDIIQHHICQAKQIYLNVIKYICIIDLVFLSSRVFLTTFFPLPPRAFPFPADLVFLMRNNEPSIIEDSALIYHRNRFLKSHGRDSICGFEKQN